MTLSSSGFINTTLSLFSSWKLFFLLQKSQQNLFVYIFKCVQLAIKRDKRSCDRRCLVRDISNVVYMRRREREGYAFLILVYTLILCMSTWKRYYTAAAAGAQLPSGILSQPCHSSVKLSKMRQQLLNQYNVTDVCFAIPWTLCLTTRARDRLLVINCIQHI